MESKPSKIKVIKASLPTYWYANKIGEIYEVYNGPVEILGEEVYVCSGEGGIVNVKDAEVVKEGD